MVCNALKNYPKKRKCLECGKEFMANSGKHKYCHNPCISPKMRFNSIKYKYILGTRSVFAKTKKDFPELAQKLRNEMMAEEGDEFTEMVLDGI